MLYGCVVDTNCSPPKTDKQVLVSGAMAKVSSCQLLGIILVTVKAVGMETCPSPRWQIFWDSAERACVRERPRQRALVLTVAFNSCSSLSVAARDQPLLITGY